MGDTVGTQIPLDPTVPFLTDAALGWTRLMAGQLAGRGMAIL